MATAASRAGRRLATETKKAFKTSEFWAYLGVLAMLLIAGAVTAGDATTDEVDALPADDVWLYATVLTVGYMISRGLSKSGSQDPYTEEAAMSGEGPGLGDRVKAASEALREGDTRTQGSSAADPSAGARRGL